MEALHERYTYENRAEKWPDVDRTNLEFHTAIHLRAGNPVLVETLEDLYARTERVRGLTHRFSVGHSVILLGDHDELMKLIRAGDANGCARVMSRHIHRGLGKLADFLEEMFGPRFEMMDESLDQKTAG